MERMPSATDLTDEQWALIEPLVTAWTQERVARSATGDPGSCDLREVVNALLYQNRTAVSGGSCRTTSRPGRRCSNTSPCGARMASTRGSRRSCAARCGSDPDD
jgi:transposase